MEYTPGDGIDFLTQDWIKKFEELERQVEAEKQNAEIDTRKAYERAMDIVRR